MAARPTWEGHLRLSLVTCPVRLFKAVGEGDQVHFNLLHRETLNRVRQAWKDPEDGFVDRKDLVRGYQVERDRYVVVEDDDLKKLKLESTRVIDIERFVDGREIDRLYWDEPYYLVPDGKPAQDAYAVIREAMRDEHQVALGRLVMSSRERIVAVETRGKGMLLSTLHSQDEVRSDEDAFATIAEVKIDKRMVEIAKQIIAQAKGPFDPAEFNDRYKEAVRALVESLSGGEAAVHRPSAAPSESNVVDLMEALRRSLKAPPGAKPEPEEKPRGAGASREAGGKRGAAPAAGRAERRTSARRGGTHAPRRAAG
ncbi:Ku protein [Falsiroseomonas sp. HW251]|uniref:non-homologous end joining protein Ku n=1 Tax=Falsiroseomonas sp. HW251 TaxID=3390998 RepID=UPI003D322388